MIGCLKGTSIEDALRQGDGNARVPTTDEKTNLSRIKSKVNRNNY